MNRYFEKLKDILLGNNYIISFWEFAFKAIKNNTQKWTCCVFALLLFSIICIFLGETYLVTGNLHDLFIPQIGAHAIKNKLILHQEFHTSFGYIYNYLNYLSLILIENFPNIFVVSDMIMLSSALFSFIIIGLFLLIIINTRNIRAIPWLILALALSLAFQVRNVSNPLDYKDLLWYGSYNKHLWSILFLQIIHIFAWLDIVQQNQLKKIKYYDLILFSFIQVLCVYVSFNYKINFFIASSLVAGSIFFLLPGKLKFIYTSILGVLFASLIILTIAISSYSYLGYLSDILHTIQSKSKVSLEDFKYIFGYLIPLFLLLLYRKKIFLREYLDYSFAEIPKLFLNIFYDTKSVITKEYFQLIKNSSFHILIGVAIFVGIIGDWERPRIYFLIAFLLYIILRIDKKLLKRVSYLLLFLFTMINIISLGYIGSSSYNKKESRKYKQINLFGESNDVLIRNHPPRGLEDLYQTFQVNSNPRKNDISFLLSYSHYPPLQNWDVPYSNAEYYAMLQDSVDRIKSISQNKNDRIMMLEFSNPLPVIFNLPISSGSYHWLHLETTFSPENIYKIYTTFSSNDIVYIPTIGLGYGDQTFLNCTFYNWNLENKRFGLYSINQYGLLFISNEKLKEYKLEAKNINKETKDDIRKHCKIVEEAIYLRYLGKLPKRNKIDQR